MAWWSILLFYVNGRIFHLQSCHVSKCDLIFPIYLDCQPKSHFLFRILATHQLHDLYGIYPLRDLYQRSGAARILRGSGRVATWRWEWCVDLKLENGSGLHEFCTSRPLLFFFTLCMLCSCSFPAHLFCDLQPYEVAFHLLKEHLFHGFSHASTT